MRFPGIIPAVVTPFDDALRIDIPALGANLDALRSAGVTAVVANGTMGEAGQLSDDERRTVIEACVAKELDVIVGVSAAATAIACRNAEAAKEAGAVAVMCLPPINYAGDVREVAAFYDRVADEGLPIMAYNNPAASGRDLEPEAIAELARDVDAVVAIKECSGDARRIAALVNDTGLEVLIGGDDWALEGYATGATGWVSGVANVVPRQCLELEAHALAGRLDEARAIYARLLPLARLDMTPKLVQYFKGAMDAVGLKGGPTRPPRLPLGPDERKILEKAVAALKEPVAA